MLLPARFPSHSGRLASWIAGGLGALLLSTGCGNPGSPLPPSLMLPQPVADLRATRTGDTVTLLWTTPRRSTDRLPLHEDAYATVCRAADTGPCVAAGAVPVQPGMPAQLSDALPAELREGPPLLLRYEIRLNNRHRQNAGPSNPAFAVAGEAPPPLRSVTAQATAEGIAVHWAAPPQTTLAPGAQQVVRLERDRVLEPGENGKPARDELAGGVPQPPQQVLLSAQHAEPGTGLWTPDHTVDTDAALNRSYRYTVQLVERVTLNGHPLELGGLPRQTPVVQAQDRFAPATPADLAAVSNAEGGTIDLSWTPGTEPDLLGYFVYRRVADSPAAPGPAAPVKMSGEAPLPTANWSDPHAVKGVRYAYSVSAVDRSGNESPRSAETVEALPESQP